MPNHLPPEKRRKLTPVRIAPANAGFVDALKEKTNGNRSAAIDVCLTYARMASAAGKDVVEVAKRDGKC